MSQEELGAKINLSKAAVSAYERGKAYPTVPVLVTLADIFQESLDSLIFGRIYLDQPSGINIDTVNETPPLVYQPKLSTAESEKSLMRLLTKTEQELFKLRNRLIHEVPDLAKEWGINQ